MTAQNPRIATSHMSAISALSIKQPWAWLIVNGYKPIENRDWRSRHRGPLLIHASGSGGKADYDACKLFIDSFTTIDLPRCEDLQRGGIVGAVRMDDCTSNPWEFSDKQREWFVGLYGFVFSNPATCDFMPIPGMPGCFKVPQWAVPAGLHILAA